MKNTNTKQYYLYHIAYPNQGTDEGYIGVTSDLENRLKSHMYKPNRLVAAEVAKGLVVNMNIIRSYKTEKAALAEENRLRPNPNMGLNIYRGGGKMPTRSEHASYTGSVTMTCMKCGLTSAPFDIPRNGTPFEKNGVIYNPSNVNNACRRSTARPGSAKGEYKNFVWNKV